MNTDNQQCSTISKTTFVSLSLAIMLLIGAVTLTWNTADILFDIRGELFQINNRLDRLTNDRWYFQYQVEFARILKENNPTINVPSPYDVRQHIGENR